MTKEFEIDGKKIVGESINVGPFSMFLAHTGKGLIGCGVFNVPVLDKFGYPAARIESPIASIEDLLEKSVVEVNASAKAKGVTVGMSGREALKLI